MLPKKNRLTLNKDFERINQCGSQCSGDVLFFKTLKNGKKYFRFGISVGSGYSKKAHVRNQAKRKIREAAYKTIPLSNTGHDIIVRIKNGISNIIKNENIQKDFYMLREKLMKTNK